MAHLNGADKPMVELLIFINQIGISFLILDMRLNFFFFFFFGIGIPIDKVALLNHKTRNYVGTKLLELTLRELFVFRFMQAGFPFSFSC